MKPTPAYASYLRVRDYIREHNLFEPQDTLVLGVSGGQDSVAMFDMLARYYPNKLIVAHVNHNIRPNSGDDAVFVQKLVKKYETAIFNIECYIFDVDVPGFARDSRLSIEEAARMLRRQALIELAKENKAKLLLAHTMTDNAESILMHIIQGSGIEGLRGMQPLSREQGVEILRPLLTLERAQTGEYCEVEKLPIALDATNDDTKYKRNWIRKEVIPLIATRNKSIVPTLHRLGENISGSMADYTELYGILDSFYEEKGFVLGRHWLANLSSIELKKAVEYCAEKVSGSIISLSNTHVKSIKHIIEKSDGSESRFSFRGITVLRHYNEVGIFVGRKG